jgi:DNA-binding transcriptional LysR family regulator
VARHMSFSAAARELFVTQSTVSRRIARLEEDLGAKLFYREPQLRLTPVGENCLSRAKSIVARIDDMLASAKAYHQDRSTKLFLCCYGYQDKPLVSKICAQMSKLHPQVKINITQCYPGPAARLLLEREVDIALTVASELEDMKGIVRYVLDNSHWVALVRKNHWLARRTFVDLDTLKGETLVIPEEEMAPKMHQTLKSALSEGHSWVEVDQHDAFILKVAAENCVALTGSPIINDIPSELITVPLLGIDSDIRYIMAYYPDKNNRILKDFVQFVKAYGEKWHMTH